MFSAFFVNLVPNMMLTLIVFTLILWLYFKLIINQQEREHYEYIVVEGKIVNRQTGDLLDTTNGAKWIFVMSTSSRLYIGRVNRKRLIECFFFN